MNKQDIPQGRLNPVLIYGLRKEIGAVSEEQTEAAVTVMMMPY